MKTISKNSRGRDETSKGAVVESRLKGHRARLEGALDVAAGATRDRLRRDRARASMRLVPLLKYIEEHLFEAGLNVASLRKACDVRDNSVAIQFHRELGQAPKAYISQRRLETSARLLIQSDLKIWRIAELVGYSNLGVYSKAFNRWAGQRPNAYRHQVRDLDQPGVSAVDFSPEFLSRAVTGQLEGREARWLMDKLMDLYPLLTEADES